MNNDELLTLKEKLARKIKEAAKKQQQPKLQYLPNQKYPQANQSGNKMNMIGHAEKQYQFEQEMENQMFPHSYQMTDRFFDEKRGNMSGNMEHGMDEEKNFFGADFPAKGMKQEQNPQIRRQFLEKKQQEESWLKPRVEPFLIQGLNENHNEEQIQKQIETMLRQPQELAANQAITTNNEEDEQSQKYKQLMLNTIKNKNKTKHKRRPQDKPTPFEKLSPPYQQIKIFASYLPRYEERRNRQLFGNTVDLGVRTLHEVVLQCYLQGIVSKDILLSIDKMGVEKQLEFIKKFAENRLGDYDFKSVKFTPLDYRRLCTILIMHDKDKYTMGERIYSVFKEITDFYHVIYNMNEDQYNKLSNSVIMSYKLTWWNDILKKQMQTFEQDNPNLDTSTIYKPPLSPLFGADINDPENDFYKAKKKYYPNKVSDRKISRSLHSSNMDDDNSKSMSRDMSGFPIIHEQNEHSSVMSQDDDQTKKMQSQFSQRPSFNSSDSEDQNQMSEISSMEKSKIRRKDYDKSMSMVSESNINTPKQGMSSVNSSRLDDSEPASGSIQMSESMSEEDQVEENSSVLDSLSVSSLALRKKKNQKRAKKARGKSQKMKKGKKNDSDISVSGSVSDDQNHDVFMESSDEEEMRSKRVKRS